MDYFDKDSLKETLKKWIDDDPSYKDLMSWYLQSEKETVICLQQALARKDYSKIAYIGDMLYGHGGTYGFFFISDIGKSIERAAIDKNDGYISALISELSNYLDFLSDEQ